MKKSDPQYGVGARRQPGRDLVDRIAVEALSFLASDSARLARFLDVTGLNVQTLRQTAAEPGFDLSIIDYLRSDEPLLRAFAAAHGYDPAAIDAARARFDEATFYDSTFHDGA